MDIWNNNIQIIEQCYPGLSSQLADICPADGCPADKCPMDGSGENIFSSDIVVERAASGEPFMSAKGILIHSRHDPRREGRRAALQAAEGAAGEGPLVILGFGLGYAAEAAAEAFPGRTLIVVEKYPSILKAALKSRDLGNFLKTAKLIFMLGGESSGITGILRLLDAKAPALVPNRALTSLDGQWYGEVERHIRSWVSKDDINTATLRRFGKRWVRNLAVNMEAIRDLPGISLLEGLLGEGKIPVFLAAAGPSLDETGPFLQEIRERCVIVAADTSLRFLLGRGTEPDFAVSVDPQYWNLRHLDRTSGERTRLIAESAVYPPALRFSFGGIFLCGSLFPLGRFIEERTGSKGRLGAGGSVATTAWDFARVLGAPEIWIAGLDLAFPALKTHFKGALFEERALAEAGRFNPVETWSARALRDGRPFRAASASGEDVLTDRRLSLYAAWFEDRFRQYPAVRNRRLSPKGIAIQGLPAASLDELMALPRRRDEIAALLDGRFKAINEDFGRKEAVEERAARYAAARGELLRGLEEIQSLAAGTAERAEKEYRKDKPDGTVLEIFDRTNKAITQSPVKDVAGFLFPPVDELEKDLKSPAEDLLKRHLELSGRLYRSLSEAAAYHLETLQKSQENLETSDNNCGDNLPKV